VYAIVETGGLQFRVEPGMKLNVPLMAAPEGSSVTLDRVLLLADDDGVSVGAPIVDGAVIEAQVLEHGRGDKVVVYKRKRRKGYEKKMGHRQDYTRIEVTGFKKG